MCQICRLGQHQLKSRPPTLLLDTSQFSTLVVIDHRRNSTPGILTAQPSGQGEPVPNYSTHNSIDTEGKA
ncbi:hypothetical protein [Acaryochloris sp. CCMEE 5410]|uniref:hypothetical protein n=1 Tax=Acaryochloris sp. CCMEE 5410 TaxID=310037 RepID=UPI000248454D|nr:hypothetical protein [Acaryochloris sp. CCMEE 5410]KAI9132945.1 hypothetical protein ON05_006060 [Acaryochloris sp. CCMEE 5410]